MRNVSSYDARRGIFSAQTERGVYCVGHGARSIVRACLNEGNADFVVLAGDKVCT